MLAISYWSKTSSVTINDTSYHQCFGYDRTDYSHPFSEGNSQCPTLPLLSHVRLFATPRAAACRAPLSFTVSQCLLKFMSGESVMLSDHLNSTVSFCLQSFPIFSNESALDIRWPLCLMTISINLCAFGERLLVYEKKKKIPEGKIRYYIKKKKKTRKYHIHCAERNQLILCGPRTQTRF